MRDIPTVNETMPTTAGALLDCRPIWEQYTTFRFFSCIPCFCTAMFCFFMSPSTVEVLCYIVIKLYFEFYYWTICIDIIMDNKYYLILLTYFLTRLKTMSGGGSLPSPGAKHFSSWLAGTVLCLHTYIHTDIHKKNLYGAHKRNCL